MGMGFRRVGDVLLYPPTGRGEIAFWDLDELESDATLMRRVGTGIRDGGECRRGSRACDDDAMDVAVSSLLFR